MSTRDQGLCAAQLKVSLLCYYNIHDNMASF